MSLLADLDRYLTQRSASDLRPRSVAHHRAMLRRFVQWLTSQGHTRWSTVTAADLDTYLTTLAERRLSIHTMQGTAWTLRVFGQWLLANGLVLRDPTADVRVPDPDEEPLPPAPLSEAQVAALARSVGGPEAWPSYFGRHAATFRFASRLFPRPQAELVAGEGFHFGQLGHLLSPSVAGRWAVWKERKQGQASSSSAAVLMPWSLFRAAMPRRGHKRYLPNSDFSP